MSKNYKILIPLKYKKTSQKLLGIDNGVQFEVNTGNKVKIETKSNNINFDSNITNELKKSKCIDCELGICNFSVIFTKGINIMFITLNITLKTDDLTTFREHIINRPAYIEIIKKKFDEYIKHLDLNGSMTEIEIDENNEYDLLISEKNEICSVNNYNSGGEIEPIKMPEIKMKEVLYLSLIKDYILYINNQILFKSIEIIKNSLDIKNNTSLVLLEIEKNQLDYYYCEKILDLNYNNYSERINKINNALDFDKNLEKFNRIFELYKELTNNNAQIKNNNLADVLNTIQIASIILTILGWILVILQGNLPNNQPIYLIAIVLSSTISVVIALLIKKLLSKNNKR